MDGTCGRTYCIGDPNAGGNGYGFWKNKNPEGEKEGVYYVVFSYIEEDAGVYAAKAAVRIAQALIAGEDMTLLMIFRT
jgi:hypothetical protein